MYTFTAFESNSGGLYFLVRDHSGKALYLAQNFEYERGSLLSTIEELRKNAIIFDSDDNLLYSEEFLRAIRHIEPREFDPDYDENDYDENVSVQLTNENGEVIPMTDDEIYDFIKNLDVIADENGVYIENMGHNARVEFNISDVDCD